MTDQNPYSPPLANLSREFDTSPGPWHQASYPFILVALWLLNLQAYGFCVVALVVAVVNCRSDSWYRFRWPWLLLVPLLAITVSNLCLRWLEQAAPDKPVQIQEYSQQNK